MLYFVFPHAGFNLEDALKVPAQDSSSKSENGNGSGSEG